METISCLPQYSILLFPAVCTLFNRSEMKHLNNSNLLPAAGDSTAADRHAPSQHPLHRQGPHIRCTRLLPPPVTLQGSVDWLCFCLTCCAFVSSTAKSMEDLKRLLLLILGCAVQVTQTHTPAHMCLTTTKNAHKCSQTVRQEVGSRVGPPAAAAVHTKVKSVVVVHNRHVVVFVRLFRSLNELKRWKLFPPEEERKGRSVFYAK